MNDNYNACKKYLNKKLPTQEHTRWEKKHTFSHMLMVRSTMR